MKRFYATAAWLPAEDGFTVHLDERALKTPGGKPFRVPTPVLAAACAEEWLAQGPEIAPATMPLTRLAFAAIERAHERDALVQHVLQYAETDLVSHRADAPASLVARQSAAWDPLAAWMGDALGAPLP